MKSVLWPARTQILRGCEDISPHFSDRGVTYIIIHHFLQSSWELKPNFCSLGAYGSIFTFKIFRYTLFQLQFLPRYCWFEYSLHKVTIRKSCMRYDIVVSGDIVCVIETNIVEMILLRQLEAASLTIFVSSLQTMWPLTIIS